MTDSNFYLGRAYDPSKQTVTDKQIDYDPTDLTTHAVVTGMTGSGKTGLCIALLEEAALMGIPAIIIDPKGDLTNLLLHFPDLAPQDFQPWIDSDLARRAKKTEEQVATEAATSWCNGLTIGALLLNECWRLRTLHNLQFTRLALMPESRSVFYLR